MRVRRSLKLWANVVLFFLNATSVSFAQIKTESGTVRLLRAPSLQQCASDSAVLSWKTDLAVMSRIEYGLHQNFTHAAQSDTPATFHVVTLRNLASDRRYFYRVVADGHVLYESEFQTYPQVGDKRYEHFSFWAMGDGGSGDAPQMAVRDQLQKLVHAGEVDFGLYLGDIVYEDGKEEDQDPKYFTPYQKILDRQVCWPALGNHDTHVENGEPYYRNRVLPVPDTLAAPFQPERWYAFTFGDAVFIALDTRYPKYELQWRFLETQLQRHRDKLWKFVFFHHPPYATPYTDRHNCKRASEMLVRKHLAPLFEKYEVDMVFSGHNHSYQRSLLRKDYVPESKGVYYLVSGGAGHEVRAVALADTTCHEPKLTQAAVQSHAYHFVQVTIAGNRLALRAIDMNGKVFDTFAYDKSETALPARMETER